jgi:integrase
MAVDNGTLAANAMRQVRPVKAQIVRVNGGIERDTSRALTRAERQAVLDYADALAGMDDGRPQTRRKRQATADLVSFMAGTGVRVTEARRLRWEQVNLSAGTVDIYGTKSRSSLRRLTMPEWLVDKMRRRAEQVGTDGTSRVSSRRWALVASERALDNSWSRVFQISAR